MSRAEDTDTPRGLPVLWHRQTALSTPLGVDSVVLFRLGERCNNRCPMCTNSGAPALDRIATSALETRVAWLQARGARRLALTGGEPTLHSGFWALVEGLHRRGLRWWLHTHGRTFHRAGVAARARRLGLERALVSFHDHDPERSSRAFGAEPGSWRAHVETVAGIDALRDAGTPLTLSCVLLRPGLPHLHETLLYIARRWPGVGVKLTAAARSGRGGAHPIAAPLAELAPHLHRWADEAAALPLDIVWEGIPLCLLPPGAEPSSRIRWGESHYLAASPDGAPRLYAMAALEAQQRGWAAPCLGCARRADCPGVGRAQAERDGLPPLVPRPLPPAASISRAPTPPGPPR